MNNVVPLFGPQVECKDCGGAGGFERGERCGSCKGTGKVREGKALEGASAMPDASEPELAEPELARAVSANKENDERVRRERAAANKSVLRSYRIKS